ncbi:MAG: hypothetical protein ACLTDX_06200 [[Clostridium] innocuum]
MSIRRWICHNTLGQSSNEQEDSGLYKTVAADEGSMVYEFRSTYQDVVGPSILFQVNIDRSAPKRPLFSEAAVT